MRFGPLRRKALLDLSVFVGVFSMNSLMKPDHQPKLNRLCRAGASSVVKEGMSTERVLDGEQGGEREAQVLSVDIIL